MTGIMGFLPKSPRSFLILVALALSCFFLWANRASYRGFFTDDDLDNLANARSVGASTFATALVKPGLNGDGTFRAAAYFYYYAMSHTAGTRYAPYVAGIQVIHLVNVALVFLLARALGAPLSGACAAALLFVFHAAALDVYWKAMYVFDLLCATFTLASLLAYVRGQTVLSVICFWLALKSKEVPILLPLILTAYEYWFGARNWKRLIPFFAISAILGGGALVSNTHRDNDYTLHFTASALRQCALYYARALAFIPYAGFAVLVAPLLAPRNLRVRWGVLTFLLLMGPMWFLPGRLFAAYLYVPLIGLAVAMSSVTAPVAITLVFLVWIPWNYRQVKPYRNQNIAESAERRSWFQSAAEFVSAYPGIGDFVYDGLPVHFEQYGALGGLRVLRPPNEATRLEPLDSAAGAAIVRSRKFGLLIWDASSHKVIGTVPAPDVSYINLDSSAPVWQLEDGWTGNQGSYRWMTAIAKARLQRPAGANVFEVKVNVSEYYLAHLHESHFEVLLNGVSLGSETLREAKPVTLRFPIAPAAPGTAEVEFRVSPPLPDPNNGPPLGQPIVAFGFR